VSLDDRASEVIDAPPPADSRLSSIREGVPREATRPGRVKPKPSQTGVGCWPSCHEGACD